MQEFTFTNTSQQISVSEHVGRTLCVIFRCILTASGFPSSMWGKLFMAATHLKNRTLHKALKMETPFKMLHGEEANLSHLCINRARTVVHINDSRNMDATAWEGQVYGYRGVAPTTTTATTTTTTRLVERFQPSTLHKLPQLGNLHTQ